MSAPYIVGLDELQKDLKELDEALGGEAVEDALLAGAFVIEGEAKLLIHQQGLIDTGFMLSSVYSASPRHSGYAMATAKAKAKNPKGSMAPPEVVGRRQAIVSVGAEYAVYHEYGTSKGLRARPFMRPALDNKLPDALKAMERATEKLLRSKGL